MVIRSPALMKRCKVIDSIKRIVVPSTRSFYRVLSKEVGAKHGFNVHGVIFDELHTQPNRKLYDVLTKNTGDARRQPLYFLITTAGIDRNSICWNQHEKARQIINGNRVDPTFYAVIYGPPDDEAEKWDWEDENNWRAVNPSIGAIIDIGKVRDAFRVAKENIDEENIFKQLRLNIWVKQSRRWMPMVAWDKCGKTPIDIESLKVRTCYYGFIRRTLRETRGFYNLREMAYDRWGAVQLVQLLEEDGFLVDPEAVKKNKFSSAPVVVPFGQGFASMSAPTKELMTLILQGRIDHGGNPVLRWNADNMVVKIDEAGNLKPDKAKATQKIDGMVALIMALDRAIKHNGEDETSDDPGIVII